jgi:hypothetical protein
VNSSISMLSDPAVLSRRLRLTSRSGAIFPEIPRSADNGRKRVFRASRGPATASVLAVRCADWRAQGRYARCLPSSLPRRASSLVRKTARRPCARWPAAPAEWLAGHCPRGCAVPGLDRERRSVPGAGSRPRAAAATRRWPCSGNRKCTARPWGSGGQRPGPGSTTSRRARPGSRWRRAASSVSLASRPNRLPRCGSGFAAVPGCEAEQPADRAAGIGVVTADRPGAHGAVQ